MARRRVRATVTIRGQVTAGERHDPEQHRVGDRDEVGPELHDHRRRSRSSSAAAPAATLPDLTINKTGPTSVAPSASIDLHADRQQPRHGERDQRHVVDTLPAGVALVVASRRPASSAARPAGSSPGHRHLHRRRGEPGPERDDHDQRDVARAPRPITNTAVVDPNNRSPRRNELNNTSAAVNTTVGGPPPAPLLDDRQDRRQPAPSGTAWGTGRRARSGQPGPEAHLQDPRHQQRDGQQRARRRRRDHGRHAGPRGRRASSPRRSIANGTVGNDRRLRRQRAAGALLDQVAELGRHASRSRSRGMVVQSAGSSIFNTATVTGQHQEPGRHATPTPRSTTVRPQVDLTITKDDSPDPVCARSWPTTDRRTSTSPIRPTASAPPAHR